jgi:hypothetical protein
MVDGQPRRAQTIKKAANPFELTANPVCEQGKSSKKDITARLHRTLQYG